MMMMMNRKIKGTKMKHSEEENHYCGDCTQYSCFHCSFLVRLLIVLLLEHHTADDTTCMWRCFCSILKFVKKILLHIVFNVCSGAP
jgi:hypothetical protein